jgi:hypothetical protein
MTTTVVTIVTTVVTIVTTIVIHKLIIIAIVRQYRDQHKLISTQIDLSKSAQIDPGRARFSIP